MQTDPNLLVYTILGVASLICWIIVLVNIFQDDGIFLGILGVFCGIYAFYYGWNQWSSSIKPLVMFVWTVCIIAMMAYRLKFGYH